ncbi:GDSL-type esterase/lipase family protein [Lentisphaera marina]|uniref:GDSL-type esterase/lipase family protein n=1 Tax=Lentisphaera marina TaxID=1111041 RepID=UPI002366BAEA|nr:GDSL-type esterase/lipase family protein [Lentisphaera marina]MDD7986150.1 GDSL-type esterase/lipase family protein [Lentisphaera marina]
MKKILMILILLSMSNLAFAELAEYPSPLRFEESIKAFGKLEKESNPPKGAIVVTGSSTIRMWNTIHADLKPLKLIHRGFGGSNMNDLYHYSDELIIKHKARAVVIYEGDNDLAAGVSPEQIHNKFLELKNKLLKSDENLRIYLLSVKPSIARKSFLDKTREVNDLFKKTCASNEQLFFIDTFSQMMEDDEIKSDVFIKDKLHYNKRGYEIWSKTIRLILLKHELKYEQIQ